MKYFIGIVPPEEEKEQLDQFRSRWKNNALPSIVEPHVTLKAQGGLTPDEKWISQVKNVCENFLPFPIYLGKPQFFHDQVLYLSVNSAEVYDLHNRIVRAISPSKESIKQYFELDDFVPHLTLGKTMWGLSKQELLDMAGLAEQDLTPYPEFIVNFIRVYHEIKPNKYVKYKDIPLKKGE